MAHGDLRGVTRARVRENYCPKCGAAPGEPCHGLGTDKRPRVANHVERRSAAKDARRRAVANKGHGHDIWDRLAFAHQHLEPSFIAEVRHRPEVVALESEIERVFAAHFILLAHEQNSPFVFGLLGKDDAAKFVLLPQYVVGPYRVDFVFAHSERLELRQCLVIELDGHEWHEKTKDQAARDKARDRYLSKHFGKVIHFTGSEIYKDVEECALETLRLYAALSGKQVDF